MKKGGTYTATIIVAFYILMIVISFISEFVDFEKINLNPYDYARITDVDYKALLIDESTVGGTVRITEKLTFDIHAFSKGNLFWELWRDLVEDNVDGLKVHYNVLSVKEILPNGTKKTYTEADDIYWYDYEYRRGPYKWYHSPGPYNPDYDRYECVFFYVDGLYRETVQFEIEYEMYNAALRYADCSELYLSMYSGSSIKHLKSFKAQILIPQKDMPGIGNYEAHTFGTNSHDFNFTESDYINPGYHTFIINLDESELKFKPYNQYIEFTLVSFGADRHKFTDYASRNIYYNDVALEELREEQEEYDNLPASARSLKTQALIIAIIVSLIIIYTTVITERELKKKHEFYSPTVNVQYFREIPSNLDPNFAATLVFSKDAKEKELKDVYASLMLSLVRKKYIALEKKEHHLDWEPKNTVFKILAHPEEKAEQPTSTFDTDATFTAITYNRVEATDTFKSIMDRIDEMEQQEPKTTENILSYPTKFVSTSFTELEPLTLAEKAYFDLLLKYNRDAGLTMHDFQTLIRMDYENTESFMNKVKRSVKNIGTLHGYFQKADYDVEKKKLLKKAKSARNTGILFITLVNFISHFTRLDYAFGAFTLVGIAYIIKCIRLRKLASQSVLLTQFGEDEYAKWRGLYEFLNSQTLMNEKTVPDVKLWEQYLVYATAFGISDKVIKALAINCPEMDVASSPMFNNTYYRSHHFHTSSRSFRSSVRSASISYSAHSGGGYYGGGGRGGGGGGGGH